MNGVRGQLGATGVFLGRLLLQPAEDLRRAAQDLEALGYSTLWVGEAWGREAFSQSALLLAATRTVTIATGIATIWGRDPVATVNAARTLAEGWPGRFVLGLGASHAQLTHPRGHTYGRPLTAMRKHLSAMAGARYDAPRPDEEAPILLAALGPHMLALAGQQAAGAFTYFAPVDHTRLAREILGAAPILSVEQALVPGVTSLEAARAIADDYVAAYLALPNYANNLRRLGYADAELVGCGSDRLFDDIIAWGDDEAIARRVSAHRQAGADHVAVQIITGPGTSATPSLKKLASTLVVR